MENTKTIAQLLEITKFPYILKNKTENARIKYIEYSDKFWIKKEYDNKNNCI